VHPELWGEKAERGPFLCLRCSRCRERACRHDRAVCVVHGDSYSRSVWKKALSGVRVDVIRPREWADRQGKHRGNGEGKKATHGSTPLKLSSRAGTSSESAGTNVGPDAATSTSENGGRSG
jgi:hypothetical protein